MEEAFPSPLNQGRRQNNVLSLGAAVFWNESANMMSRARHDDPRYHIHPVLMLLITACRRKAAAPTPSAARSTTPASFWQEPGLHLEKAAFPRQH